ncbi:butyrate kinase [bacterium]|nr:butyrate kinase [bacterium]
MKEGILVLNPGTTSTKVAVFDGIAELWRASIEHDTQDIHQFAHIAEQLDYRYNIIRDAIPADYLKNLCAVVGRGGLLRPIAGGTYAVDDELLSDVKAARWGEHASNLGSMLADRFAQQLDIDAYVVDPVTTDEFDEISRVSGVPGIVRKCRAHALNIKATARRAAAELAIPFNEARLVVAHLGGGISIAAIKEGRISDVNDGLLGMGPFSPERSGALPLQGVIDLVRDQGYDRAKEIFSRESGFVGYFGTADLREIEKMIESGDKQASLIWEAMIYQVAKEIGAMAAALQGNIHGVVVTGGLIKSDALLERLNKYISYLGRIFEYRGEEEMLALAEGALRVIRRQEAAKTYGENS